MSNISLLGHVTRLVLVWLTLLALVPATPTWAQLDVQWNEPDTCLQTFGGTDLQRQTIGALSSGFEYHYTTDAVNSRQLALIIPGNGFDVFSYRALAEHLAMNSVVTAIIPNPADANEVLVRIETVLNELGWSKDDTQLGIALIGHSRGGGLAVKASILNHDDAHGYPIRAVVGLGPITTAGAEGLAGEHASGLLVIYGSQDEDVDGYDEDVPKEGFAIYDAAGTEASTVCADPLAPCGIPATPALDRTMIFVYGADHAGLVGMPINPLNIEDPQDLEYIEASDQLCLVKAYVTGFLRWQMLGITVYRSLLRGDWAPDSVDDIVSFVPDAFGNPAPAPLRMFFQSSPHQRVAVQNFEAGTGNPATSHQDVIVQGAGAGALNGANHYNRHETGLALLGWQKKPNDYQWVFWDVPADARDGSTFSHFALRLGQLQASSAPHQNTVNQDQALWVGFEDGGGSISWHWIPEIPSPDLYMHDPSKARSAMHTERIPMQYIRRYAQIDDIRRVIVVVPPDTEGTLMVDSLEWQRDY